jgi:hypothetical protein
VTSADLEGRERELVRTAIVRLRARVMALVFGWVGGCGLFVATAWLLVRDGPNVGQHLSLLRNYFPGYSVTWPGALLGFCYGAGVGALLGWTIASIYNRVAGWRNPDA